jgi:hypothetical protein
VFFAAVEIACAPWLPKKPRRTRHSLADGLGFDSFPDEEAEQRREVAGLGAAVVCGWTRDFAFTNCWSSG